MLEKLLAALINALGPALIEAILNWLRGLSGQETKELAKGISEELKKNMHA